MIGRQVAYSADREEKKKKKFLDIEKKNVFGLNNNVLLWTITISRKYMTFLCYHVSIFCS